MGILRLGSIWVAMTGLTLSLTAQTTAVELRQELTRFNLRSSDPGLPVLEVVGATTNSQFRGAIHFGGAAVPSLPIASDPPALKSSLAESAGILNLPRGQSGDRTWILTRALVGGPLHSRQATLLFGAEIPVPAIDESGTLIGAQPFRPANVADISLFAQRLWDQDRPVDAWLRTHGLSEATLVSLTNLTTLVGTDSKTKRDVLRTNLVMDLNKLLEGPSIYELERFAGVVLRQETEMLSSRTLNGESLRRFNRLLLEDAYPVELQRESDPRAYWAAEPFSAGEPMHRGYYWSPHAGRVFAVQPGAVSVIWRRREPGAYGGSEKNFGTVTNDTIPYTVITNRYLVSGSPVKPPRQIYWTEGDFFKTGKPVKVEGNRVSKVNITFNSSFPPAVTNPFPASVPLDPQATNTLWFKEAVGSIAAYNREGRAFVELLGSPTGVGTQREFLGFEIVDVRREPAPAEVTVELGEVLTPFPEGTEEDSDLWPEPILSLGETFVYQHGVSGSDRPAYYAARATVNRNDLQVHWMEEGVAGLRWPARFVRYRLVWPNDVGKYSHYLRPRVGTDSEASATAVPLPGENAPVLQYQDPLDFPRGKLTPENKYYTFLSDDQPAHRGLLRFVAGDRVWFERVFSWLESELDATKGFLGSDSVATHLSAWNAGTETFTWPEEGPAPRLYANSVFVGDRVLPPAGEPGSGFNSDSLVGYIVPEEGDSFHPDAYIDPFARGFAAARRGAIIPVNAIPDNDQLRVLWFRSNDAPAAAGFQPTLWPAVSARYTLEWPTNASEIVLADNRGSGPLPSLQARGSIYYQNDSSLAGYNPNEEHALIHGGQAYALRDDLNITKPTAEQTYSSAPFVLLSYEAEDGRPAMRAFRVLREKPEEGKVFKYPIIAGTVLQPPMPLPLLERPVDWSTLTNGVGPRSLNQEVGFWTVKSSGASDAISLEVPLSTLEEHGFRAFHEIGLFPKDGSGAEAAWYLPLRVSYGTRTLSGLITTNRPLGVAAGKTEVDDWTHPAGLEVRVVYRGAEAFPLQIGETIEAVYGLFDHEKRVAKVLFRHLAQDTFLELLLKDPLPEGTAVSGLRGLGSDRKLWSVAGWLSDDPRLAFSDVTRIKGECPGDSLEKHKGKTARLVLADAVIGDTRLPSMSWAGVLSISSWDQHPTQFYVYRARSEGEDAPTSEHVKHATHLVIDPQTAAADQYMGARVRYAEQGGGGEAKETAGGFTLQDRKQDIWVFRGPQEAKESASMAMQFYYKTLPGFFFPELAQDQQPPLGTLSPYLRNRDDASGEYVGPAYKGQDEAKANPLQVQYEPIWPADAPTLQMGETLTRPKRGLPAVRGQSSLQIVYQQSDPTGDKARPSAVLHDSTREKTFELGRPGGVDRLDRVPSSVRSQSYRGKQYFPNLSPHLSERFFFDSSRGEFGALVLGGRFVDEPLGDDYLLLNLLSDKDVVALKELCLNEDPAKAQWDAAINGLSTRLELFVDNPGRPGTYLPSSSVTVGATESAVIQDDDVAVDSYALTAVGPGEGYVTLISGNGLAFTPADEPVSLHILRVVDTLYRGDVKTIASSNPLDEKLTLQQVVDLAGASERYVFEWKIASPVDGKPPKVYELSPRTLLGNGPWSHLAFPLPSDAGAPGEVVRLGLDRVAADLSVGVRPISRIPFESAAAVDDEELRVALTLGPGAGQHLVVGNRLILRYADNSERKGWVHTRSPNDSELVVELEKVQGDSAPPEPTQLVDVVEEAVAQAPQSVVFREFTTPVGPSFADVWLSLDLDEALEAKVYLDGQLAAVANRGLEDTPTSTPPENLSPLKRAYRLNAAMLSGGTPAGDEVKHWVVVEFFSGARPEALLAFNLRIEANDVTDVTDTQGWQPFASPDGLRVTLGESADVRSLSDNYLIMRYQTSESTHASFRQDPTDPTRNTYWSAWTEPQLAEGWIKRVLKGINPFNQRVTDLFSNQINTDASILAQAGPRWEGDVALNLDSINDYGLIEIYETVLKRGRQLSLGAGINYGPANDALLLAAGYLNDLYMMLGNEAWADAANPTIGIGTRDNTYGDIATALFSFKGQLPSLLEEELALLRGRDDALLPGVEVRPVYNRLVWNYTRGIDSGEVIYALNYNILDQNTDGVVDAEDALRLYPQGHGDAYGHFLTALKGYYSLLFDPSFDWVPRIEAVTVLGKPVSVDYQDERKFAAAAAAVARSGKQVFDLTWRRDFQSGAEGRWGHLSEPKTSASGRTAYSGADHWAARTGQGSYLNWLVGNAILPDHDTDSAHSGSIQQVDRTTVPELHELPEIGASLQASMDAAEGGLTPLGVPATSIPFDLNPLGIANAPDTSHFEQIYGRAKQALKGALVAFDDAKDVTRLMRSEEDSLADFRTNVEQQELAYKNQLIELYGTPYPEDVGPGGTYETGYDGPDLVHYMYLDRVDLRFGNLLNPTNDITWRIDIQNFSPEWATTEVGGVDPLRLDKYLTQPYFAFVKTANADAGDPLEPPDADYLAEGENVRYVTYHLASDGFFAKPGSWAGRRASPGRIQTHISDIALARNAAYEALFRANAAKRDLDWALEEFEAKRLSIKNLALYHTLGDGVEELLMDLSVAFETLERSSELAIEVLENAGDTVETFTPKSIYDPFSAIRGTTKSSTFAASRTLAGATLGAFVSGKVFESINSKTLKVLEGQIRNEEWISGVREAISSVRDKVNALHAEYTAINHTLLELSGAREAYLARVAEGDRIQAEREVFRQRAAAVIQGFRSRDAAFRVFRSEKLERYKSLFDTAAQYAFLAAQAYDYDTGLLHTPRGREFVNRIVRSRALGVMADGEPQFAGSNAGDPGLSSVMAEMSADWSVLRGRLGIKNPDAYGTTVSLRTENFRILKGSDGANRWMDILRNARTENVLEDSDVRRYCMQIDAGNGLPVPGIIVEFGTTIAEGLNLFGRPLAPGDHAFSPAFYATKIFHMGVALEGYQGMDDPNANGTAITGSLSQDDPSTPFLDANGLSANPYIYLVPVGLDSMRSPPLGDASVIRTWKVDDVAVPLPFNIGGSAYSTPNPWQTATSLQEPLFAIRKHQPFRPVSSSAIFGTLVVYWTGGELERSPYTNTRLLGRSVWNSKWKLVIPGRTLLADPQEGLDRFVRTVKDIKLHFTTYSYSGN